MRIEAQIILYKRNDEIIIIANIYRYIPKYYIVKQSEVKYSFGGVMPGRHYVNSSSYRYNYQGQENAENSKWQAFELRMHNSDLGRWFAPDPYGQFHSPYISMGNNPISGVDPDGGFVNTISQGWYNAMGPARYAKYLELHHGGNVGGKFKSPYEEQMEMYQALLEYQVSMIRYDNYDDRFNSPFKGEDYDDFYNYQQSWSSAIGDAQFDAMMNGSKFDAQSFNDKWFGRENKGQINNINDMLGGRYAGMGADNSPQSFGEIFADIERANKAWEETKQARAENTVKRAKPKPTLIERIKNAFNNGVAYFKGITIYKQKHSWLPGARRRIVRNKSQKNKSWGLRIGNTVIIDVHKGKPKSNTFDFFFPGRDGDGDKSNDNRVELLYRVNRGEPSHYKELFDNTGPKPAPHYFYGTKEHFHDCEKFEQFSGFGN